MTDKEKILNKILELQRQYGKLRGQCENKKERNTYTIQMRTLGDLYKDIKNTF